MLSKLDEPLLCDNNGLSDAEASRRLKDIGPNRIMKLYDVSFIGIALEEITEPMILLLLVVGVIYSIWGKLADALTIFSIIILLVLVEVWNEYRAKKSIASLSKIAAPQARVLRDGKIAEIDAEKVVPGDVIILGQGTRIAADARLFAAYSLQADESALTGESFAQDKNAGDEVYAGTTVVSGEGKAEVYATGEKTRIGKISATAKAIKPPKTPMQKAMKSLAISLSVVAVLFSILIPAIGILRGQPMKEMVLTGLALAFAVIPEELPIIVTMVLGLGAYQLSKNNFLVKKVRAAEVMGNVTTILTDKTGTITENVMKVVSVYPPENEGTIFSAAYGSMTDISLSPTDKAIVDRCRLQKIESSGRVARERSFDSESKTKSILREMPDGLKLYVIGAPEKVLSLSRNQIPGLEEELRKETAKGRRVVAVAHKKVLAEARSLSFEDLEKDMDIVGIVSIEDMPREGVKNTIETADAAGIRTIMVTGDHPLTAAHIARQVSIPDRKVLTGAELDKMSDGDLKKTVREVSVFARATPEHKYRLVKALRDNGEVVAVTGDGINDVLALKGADVGISMGIKGTDVAKDAADIVLADDNFVTISRGIFEGRKFFDNVKKGIKYYLSVKVALVLVFLLPVIAGLPMPFSPVQIILLELFMDLAASAAFVAEPAERSIYKIPPRHTNAKIFDNKSLLGIALSGISLFAAVIATYYYALSQGLPAAEVQTIAFATWIAGHVFLAFVSRSDRESLISMGPLNNKVMDLWALAAFAFLAIVIGVPLIGSNLKLTMLEPMQVILVIVVAFLATFWLEIPKAMGLIGEKVKSQ